MGESSSHGGSADVRYKSETIQVLTRGSWSTPPASLTTQARAKLSRVSGESIKTFLSNSGEIVVSAHDGGAGGAVRDHHDDGHHPLQGGATPLHRQVAPLLKVRPLQLQEGKMISGTMELLCLHITSFLQPTQAKTTAEWKFPFCAKASFSLRLTLVGWMISDHSIFVSGLLAWSGISTHLMTS